MLRAAHLLQGAAGVTSNTDLRTSDSNFCPPAKLKYNINDETLTLLYMVKAVISVITDEPCLLCLDDLTPGKNKSQRKVTDTTPSSEL